MLADLKETYYVLGQTMRYKERLDRDDFETVAGFWLHDVDKHFEIWRGPNRFVDTWMFLAGAAVFCNAKIADKLKFVYSLFDYDDKGELSQNELTVLILASVRGMARLAGVLSRLDAFLSLPVNSLSKHVFNYLKIDPDEKITFKEFQRWFYREKTVIQFVRYYVDGTDVRFLARKKHQKMKELKELFIKYAKPRKDMGNHLAVKAAKHGTKLVKAIFPEEDEPEGEDAQNLVDLIEHHGAIFFPPYMALTSTVQSFRLVDKQNLGRVEVNEIKALLWVLTEKEPLEKRVQFEQGLLDPDHTGYVTQGKWISNHAIDPSTLDKKQQDYLADLKKNFDVLDMDKDGKLNIRACGEFLYETILRYMGDHHVSSEGKRYLSGVCAWFGQWLFKQYNRAEHLLMDWKEVSEYIPTLEEKGPQFMEEAFKFQTHPMRKLFIYDSDGNLTLDKERVRKFLEQQVASAVKNRFIERLEARAYVNDVVEDTMDKFKDSTADQTFDIMNKFKKQMKMLNAIVAESRAKVIDSTKDKIVNAKPSKYDKWLLVDAARAKREKKRKEKLAAKTATR